MQRGLHDAAAGTRLILRDHLRPLHLTDCKEMRRASRILLFSSDILGELSQTRAGRNLWKSVSLTF